MTSIASSVPERHLEPSLPTRVYLKQRYPQSWRNILRRCFLPFLALVLAAIGFIQVGSITDLDTRAGELLQQLMTYLFTVTLVVAVFLLIYEFLYHFLYDYVIELEHLTITRGVFFRSRSSFPIAGINDVSLQRNFFELLFGLHSLSVLTASPVSEFGSIEGLPKSSAIGLQSHLLILVETTRPNVNENAAEKIMANVLTAEQADNLLHGEN